MYTPSLNNFALVYVMFIKEVNQLRLPDYVTMAQGGGKVINLTHRPLLPPGNTPGTHFA